MNSTTPAPAYSRATDFPPMVQAALRVYLAGDVTNGNRLMELARIAGWPY